ncbi:hypothetical protein ABH900_002080 [Stenotrophomonas sp. AN71]|uniref:TadE family protein n=1 Tax=Stenotrophomonas sp. AN71 TaxID=3156253 RepID=UPI003D1BA617
MDRERPFRSSRQQRGQSLTEVAVLCAVLVPIFLLIPILAKYIHARQATQQAARAIAWEATVSPDYKLPASGRQRDLAVDRYFGRADDPIVSQPQTGARDAAVGDVLMNTFSNQPLVRRGDLALVSYTSTSAGGMMKKISDVTSMFGSFPPNRNGLTQAQLRLDVQDLKSANGSAAAYLEPFDSLGLKLQATHVVLADPWNAAGSGLKVNSPRSVIAQVKPLVPSQHMAGIAKAFDGLSGIPMIGTLSRLDPGYIAPDVVPVDKLPAYAPSR